MATQGLDAWIFKELSKNPSLCILALLLLARRTDRLALDKVALEGEAGSLSTAAPVRRGGRPRLKHKPCLNLKSRALLSF